MTERWAEATWVPATSDAGSFTGGGAKGLLHTTEGHRYADALSVYMRDGYWPHATLSYESGRFEAWQHLDLDVAGKALQHPATLICETNRDNVVQVEIVGSAERSYAHAHGLLYVEDFPVEYLAGISRWMRYVERVHGVPSVIIAPFGLPGTVRRLKCPEWHALSGWCGHCHVPGNTHTDPGALAVERLLAPTPIPPAPTPEEPMAMPRSIPDLKTPVGADGRVPHWAIDTQGNVYCWDRARQLKSLSAFTQTHPPIEDVAAHPSGDGVVLFGNDGHYEPASGVWARSTYTILVGM